MQVSMHSYTVHVKSCRLCGWSVGISIACLKWSCELSLHVASNSNAAGQGLGHSLFQLGQYLSKANKMPDTTYQMCPIPAGFSKAGLPSWDAPAVPSQAPLSRPVAAPAHRTTSAEPSWQNSKPMAGPSWIKQSGSSPMASSAGPGDPFAGLPAPQAAVPSRQGGATDLMSDSFFSSLSTGKLFLLGRKTMLGRNTILLFTKQSTPWHLHHDT